MSNSIFCMMFMIRVEFYMHKGASKRPYSKRISVTVFRGILHANFNIILLNNRRGQELVDIPWNDELHNFYILHQCGATVFCRKIGCVDTYFTGQCGDYFFTPVSI